MDTWGQGAVNNNIGWGQAPIIDSKTGNFGKICFTSYAGKTSITGQRPKASENELIVKK